MIILTQVAMISLVTQIISAADIDLLHLLCLLMLCDRMTAAVR